MRAEIDSRVRAEAGQPWKALRSRIQCSFRSLDEDLSCKIQHFKIEDLQSRI